MKIPRVFALAAFLALALTGAAGPSATAPSATAPAATSPAATGPEGSDLVGKPLPDWGDLRFVDAPAHRRPADFAGRTLVLRFWTSGCPYCRVSAPTLSDWARRYRDRGLTVIGIYHPKPPRPVSDEEVRRAARAIGLDAVLAVDERWSALERLWLRGRDRSFTSASLLVDARGVVRAVHRGGELTPDAPDDRQAEYRDFAAALRSTLSAKL
jgi:thiol-disulfide isomerase/thioredoxin